MLDRLKAALALAETLNFHRAAQRLEMSQPHLTRIIKSLERDLGVILFERGPHGVSLTPDGARALKEAAPNGIDGHFENVGGMILDAVMLRMNAFGRIAFCGMIAGYNGEPIPMANPSLILVSRLKLQGFIVSEHMNLWPQALKELGTMVATGKLKYRETVAEGLGAAPEAFLGLLKGRNFGKQLVKLV